MFGTTSFNNFTLFSCVCPESIIQILGKLTEKVNYYVCLTRRDNLEKHVEVYQRHL